MIAIYQPRVGGPKTIEAVDLDDARDFLSECLGAGVKYTNCPQAIEHANDEVKIGYMRFLLKHDLCSTT